MKTTIYHRTIHFTKKCNGKTFAVVVRPASEFDMQYVKGRIDIIGAERAYEELKQFSHDNGVRGIRTGNMYYTLNLPKIG